MSRARVSDCIESLVPLSEFRSVGKPVSASREVRAETVDASVSVPRAWGDRFAGRRGDAAGLGCDGDSARFDWMAAFKPTASMVGAFSINSELGFTERASRWMNAPFCEPDSIEMIDGVEVVVARFRWTRVGLGTSFWTVSDGVFAGAFSVNTELGFTERASRWMNAPFCEPDSTCVIDGVGAVVATFRWTPVGLGTRFAAISRWLLAEGSPLLGSGVGDGVDATGRKEDRLDADGIPELGLKALSLKRSPKGGAKSVVKLGRVSIPGSRIRLRKASLLLAGRTDATATCEVPRICDSATARRAASRTSLAIGSLPIDGWEAVAEREVGND